jgi:hypothetical protein
MVASNTAFLYVIQKIDTRFYQFRTVKKMVSTRSSNNTMTGRPTPITIVPYVYKDGDDAPRRSPRLAAQKVVVTKGRKSARLASAKALAAEPATLAAEPTVAETIVAASEPTAAEPTVAEPTVAASEPTVAEPASEPTVSATLAVSPRKRKDLDYKSIVRTRAQKAADIKEQHVQHMQIATAFYKKFGREPSANSKEVGETGLANYLDTLRFCMNTMETPEPFNALVAEHMPWFEWSVAEKKTTRASCLQSALVGLGFIMAVGAGLLTSYRILTCTATSCVF